MFKVVKRTSKKGNEFLALAHEDLLRGYDIYVTFDVNVISKVSGKSLKELYLSDTDIYLD